MTVNTLTSILDALDLSTGRVIHQKDVCITLENRQQWTKIIKIIHSLENIGIKKNDFLMIFSEGKYP